MTETPLAIVNADGSISVHHESTVSRSRAMQLAHEFLHAVMESRGFDAHHGTLSEIEDGDYIFVFSEFVMITSVLREGGTAPRTVIQWLDDGEQNEVSGHPDTETWFYRSAQADAPSAARPGHPAWPAAASLGLGGPIDTRSSSLFLGGSGSVD
jgi:hypothetical protein